MSLSHRQLARLGELLDEALEVPLERRGDWIDALPEADQPLLQSLRESLCSEDPAGAIGGALDRQPRIAATGGANCGRIERRAGERLGAYELLRPLGAGGMAEVWLASRADGAFERQVALKIPHLRDMPAETAERFARECRILATLETPNIARLYDAGVDATGVPYIAMEYVHGEPLVDWCDARALDVPARVGLFIHVLDAVSVAHRHQILHRDLKPSNILVSGEGQVRLLDFGVARLLHGDAQASPLTQDWGRALTPAYASPEMLRGEGVDLRSDIYSLGVVLHELLTGTRPGGPPTGTTGGSQVRIPPGALRDVLKRALAPDPADRIPDAAAFAGALRPFAGNGARRLGIARLRVRHRWFAGLAALTLIVAGAIALLRARTEPVAPVAAAAQTIAVLPFTNLTGDPEQEILADGLAEEVANQLAAIPELRVTGRTSSFSFKGKNEDLRDIARKLDVSSVLEGSVRGDGERLRVTVQLIDGSDGSRRWSSRPYEHELSGILAAQDEIARDVARALSVTLDVGALSRTQGGTMNLEAARRYWEWRELTFSDRIRGSDFARRRVQLLRDAVRLDPQFAVAWGGLAWSLMSLSFEIGDSQRELADRLRAEEKQAWSRVTELAPESWMALQKRAYDLRNADRWAESEAVARQAMESGPLTLERSQSLINLLFSTGRIDEAIDLQARVMALEPRWLWISRDQQMNFHAARRFEELDAEYERSRSLDGDHSTPDFLALLRVLARQDADPGALRDRFQRVSASQVGAPQWWHDFGAAIPDRLEMLSVLRRAHEAGEDVDAQMADAMGDHALALSALDRRIASTRGKYSSWWEAWMLVYSRARADPRFKRMMRDSGLADFWRRSGKWPDFCGPDGDSDFKCG